VNKVLRNVLVALGYFLGVYLIIRGAIEPFIINYGDSDSYKSDWGGPTIVGVMAVHILPGAISALLIYLHQKQRYRRR
jgi:hypothetical protein